MKSRGLLLLQRPGSCRELLQKGLVAVEMQLSCSEGLLLFQGRSRLTGHRTMS